MTSVDAPPRRELLVDRWRSALRSGRYASYALLTGIAALLGFLKGAAFARVLGDVGYGYYALALLTTTYLMYPMSLGLKDGLLRNASMLFGAGKADALTALRDEVFSAILLAGAAIAATFSIVFWSWSGLAPDTRATLALAGPLSLVTLLFNVVVVDVQARQRVVALGASLAGRQALTLGFGLVAALVAGFLGVIFAEIAALALMCLVLIVTGPDALRLVRPRTAHLAEVFRVGVPLAGDALLRNLSVSIDKWFVSLFLGIEALGQYAFASISLAAALAANSILMQVLGPKWLGEFGRAGDLGRVHQEIRRVVILGGGAVVLASALLGAPGLRLLAILFSGYEDGLAVLPVIWIGVVVQIVNLFHWTAIAAGRGKTLMRLSVMTNGAIAIGCGVAAWFDLGLAGYAWVFSGGRVLSFAINWALSRHIVLRHG